MGKADADTVSCHISISERTVEESQAGSALTDRTNQGLMLSGGKKLSFSTFSTQPGHKAQEETNLLWIIIIVYLNILYILEVFIFYLHIPCLTAKVSKECRWLEL